MRGIYILLILTLISGLQAREVPERFADKTLVFTLNEGFLYDMLATENYKDYYWTRLPENIMIGMNEGETFILALRFKDTQDFSSIPNGKDLVVGIVKDGTTYLDNSAEQSDLDMVAEYLEYSEGIKYPVDGYGGKGPERHVPYENWEFGLEIYFINSVLHIRPYRNGPLYFYYYKYPRGYYSSFFDSFYGYYKTIDSIGDYYFELYHDRYGIQNKGEYYVSVLQYNPPHPKVIVKEMSFFNGINKFVDLVDFTVDPLSDDSIPANDAVITLTEIQAHPSVSVVDEKFQVNLGTYPVTEAGEAIYEMTVTNAYGSDTEQVTLKLFASSIKVNKTVNGDTSPSGIIGGTPGEEVEITAVPDANYNFLEWTGDVPAENYKDNPITLAFPESEQIEITPIFEEKPYVEMYSLVLDFDGSSGTVTAIIDGSETEYTSPPAGALTYEKNTTIKLKAVPKTGNEFIQWLGDVSISQYKSAEIETVLSADKSFSAIFESQTTTDSSNNNNNNSNSSNPPTVTYDPNYQQNSDALIRAMLQMNSSYSGGKVTDSSSDKQENSGYGGASGNNYKGYQDFFKQQEKGADEKEISPYSPESDQYFFKYQIYEDEEGNETYYSTDEVEKTSGFYNSINSFWNTIFTNGGEQ